jgi:hypothetical protein
LPGIPVRQTLSLPIPSELDAPYGYLLALSVWDFNNPESKPTPTGNLPVLYDATIELARVTSLADAELPAAPDSAQFTFANGIQLNGFTYPETVTAGETAEFAFWWQAGTEMISDHTHFLHLLSSVSPEQHLVFAQTPLAGILPTSNWINSLRFVDRWQVTIPAEANAGTYEVVSGLFSQASGERLAVTGVEGAPTRDFSMVLGQIAVEATP